MAHVAGLPVEETVEAFAPVAVVSLGALAASMRTRWRDAWRALRRRHRLVGGPRG
jgi:hypothetical protein